MALEWLSEAISWPARGGRLEEIKVTRSWHLGREKYVGRLGWGAVVFEELRRDVDCHR